MHVIVPGNIQHYIIDGKLFWCSVSLSCDWMVVWVVCEGVLETSKSGERILACAKRDLRENDGLKGVCMLC